MSDTHRLCSKKLHEMSPDNVYDTKRGYFICKACTKARTKAYQDDHYRASPETKQLRKLLTKEMLRSRREKQVD